MKVTSPRRRRAAGRLGFVATVISGLVFAVIGIVLAVGAVSAHSAAERSSYTQSHGVEETATVQHVADDENTSCTGHGHCSTSYTAKVTAQLSKPVGGLAVTTVNVSANVALTSGQRITVRVDPDDPGYAELPGSPYVTRTTSIGLAIGAVVALILGALVLVLAVRRRRRRRLLAR